MRNDVPIANDWNYTTYVKRTSSSSSKAVRKRLERAQARGEHLTVEGLPLFIAVARISSEIERLRKAWWITVPRTSIELLTK